MPNDQATPSNPSETFPITAQQPSPLIQAINRFFTKIDFATEDEAILPSNQRIVRQAFEGLMNEMGWHFAEVNFQELLEECTGDHAFRADGKTLDWYHQIGQIVNFLQLVRSGKIDEDALKKEGGAEVAVSAILRHDSWEDHDKSPALIYASTERRLHKLFNERLLDDDGLLLSRHKAATVGVIVDLMTRKVPVRDDYNGDFLRKPNGKIVKKPRFNGDLNEYNNRHLQKVLAVLLKYQDSIDGVSTRFLENTLERESKQPFSVEDNMRYVRERRGLYSRRSIDDFTSEKFPRFEAAIRSSDAMLGIVSVMLETVNDYFEAGSTNNPYSAAPMRVSQYIQAVKEGYEGMPRAFRPDLKAIRRLEKIAQRNPANADQAQKSERMKAVLNHAIYPALVPLIGERRPDDLLQGIKDGYFQGWRL